jgi:mono/diheme cytochrome c family protein
VNKGPFLIFGAFVVVALLLVVRVVGGQGAEGAADVPIESHDEDGKLLFANNCGPCHTLAAAGADGVVGPNLDSHLTPGGTATYEGSYNRTLAAITCGFGGGRMPAGILQGENAMEVSAFVGAYAGQKEGGPLVDTRDEDEAPRDPPPESCGGDEPVGETDTVDDPGAEASD